MLPKEAKSTSILRQYHELLDELRTESTRAVDRLDWFNDLHALCCQLKSMTYTLSNYIRRDIECREYQNRKGSYGCK